MARSWYWNIQFFHRVEILCRFQQVKQSILIVLRVGLQFQNRIPYLYILMAHEKSENLGCVFLFLTRHDIAKAILRRAQHRWASQSGGKKTKTCLPGRFSNNQ